MNGSETRTVHVAYDKSGKLDVTSGKQLPDWKQF